MSRGRALILVENLSVPFDRRVWQEAQALTRGRWDVTVICPTGHSGDRCVTERIDGVDIHRFPLDTATGKGPASYAREYGTAMREIARLSRRLHRQTPFDVVHVCNPPDILFLAVLPLRRRAAFLFDHHDLVPELFLSRFDRGRNLLYYGTRLAERLTFALADVVISTNESYRTVALTRGRKNPRDVFVVRSAPDLDRFRPVAPHVALRRGRSHLLAYVGVMGPQDGVDHALQALAALRARRRDWHAIFVGSGDVFEQMGAMADELCLGDFVEFTGRVSDEDLVSVVSTADVCLAPDPWNPLNDVSTMNKIVEYMALGRPIVSYDLKEARVSAGEAAVYVRPNDPTAFAEAISDLLDDPERRDAMSRAGRGRVASDLSWERSSSVLLEAYERAVQRCSIRRRPVRGYRKARRAV